MSFQFLDPGPLVDRELELITPDARWTDEVLRTCAHPLGRGDPTFKTTRQQIEDYLRAAPGGRFVRETRDGGVPQYLFWMKLRPEYQPPVMIAGSLSLRIGNSDDMRMYLGHIGYNVYPVSRGNHYAERACRLLFGLARRHGMRRIVDHLQPRQRRLTQNLRALGAVFIETVPLPTSHVLYQRGERLKCRFRVDLNVVAESG